MEIIVIWTMCNGSAGPSGYCSSAGGTYGGDGITNVTFAGINNSTGIATSGYTDYTCGTHASVTVNNSYNLTVKVNTGGSYTNDQMVWIDWNQNGVFTDPGESYNLGSATNVTNGNSSLCPLSITVPASALGGTTRMRVSSEYNATPTACNPAFDGEVEDYYVDVTACVTPTTQASNITFTSVGCTSMTVNWTNGNGSKRIVKCNTSNSFTAPVNGTDPTANSVFGGTEQVVYNGTGSSVTVTGLTAGTTYWFRLYEADCSGSYILFQTSTASNNPLSQPTSPAAPATPGAITGTATQCQNATGQVFSISTVTNATTYTWTVPTGWSITSGQGTTSLTVTAGSAGQNGNITVTAGNTCGTSTAQTFAVTVLGISTPDAGPDQYLCSGTSSTTMVGSGTGSWIQVAGPVSATITTPSSATTTITGISTSGTYVFRYSGTCGAVYDDMMIIKQ